MQNIVKRLVLFLFFLLSSQICLADNSLDDKKYVFVVEKVIDGDTILLSSGQKVRYIGIDTPETKHPKKGVEFLGKEAYFFNKKLVEGKSVKLEFDVQKFDKYGRWLCYVYVDDIFVNAKLIEEGYAQVYTVPPNVKYQELFLEKQREAIENKKGLWADTVLQTPSESDIYVGNKRSKVFHNKWCVWAKRISLYNRTIFSTRNEATSEGYRPCKICNP